MTRGLLCGRFLPPHAGHQFMAETARALVDELVVLVLARPDDPLPASLRVDWLADMMPWARIRMVALDGPGEPTAEAIALAIGAPVDVMFASDTRLAGVGATLGVRLELIDPARLAVPVTSAAVRADPARHWTALPPPVKAFHARTICLHGPESTGKSTLAPRLAAHFDSLFVPEYGRTYCEQHGLDLSMADLVAIGRTHAAMARAARRQCHRRLILDTDPLMTAAWADMLFGRRDPWFDAFNDTADFYLLLDIDLPWVDDGTRFFGASNRRRRFFDLSRAELERRGLPHAVIGGAPEMRYAHAIAAIAAAGLG